MIFYSGHLQAGFRLDCGAVKWEGEMKAIIVKERKEWRPEDSKGQGGEAGVLQCCPPYCLLVVTLHPEFLPQMKNKSSNPTV